MQQTILLFFDLTVYALGLAAVAAGAVGSLDKEDVERVFGDPASLQSGRVQLFAIQYYLYLGLLQGVLVYPPCLLTTLLSTPMIVVVVCKVRQEMKQAQGYSSTYSY